MSITKLSADLERDAQTNMPLLRQAIEQAKADTLPDEDPGEPDLPEYEYADCFTSGAGEYA